MNKGVWYALGAYICWGLFPIYWKWLAHVAAIELIAHRIVWSCLMLIGVILVTRQWRAFRAAIAAPRVVQIYFIAAIIIGLNLLVYVWGVTAGFIVETSLGYFINPLVNILLGMIFLRERLRAWQWLPLGLATVGVVYLTITYGSLPLIALTLAMSFAFYALVKKTAPLNSLYGLAFETSVLFIPATIYLFFVETTGHGAFLHTGIIADILLVGAGIVTTIPLLLFASAARRVPLSVVGILQYLSPTLQFLCGVLIFHEPFNQSQLIGFGFVWLALIIFAIESIAAHRAQAVAAIAE